MDFKGLLGSVSPVYGAISGEGMLGKVLNPKAAAQLEEEAKSAVQERNSAAARKKMDVNVAAAQARRQAPSTAALNAAVNTRKMKSGGKVSSASKRADGCAQRGKTKGRMI